MTRSRPVGLAQSDPIRAGLYRAALEQFEELIKASASSGPASRPLPLFYALTQASRAITAVRGGPDHRGHGLKLGDRKSDALRTEVIPVHGQTSPGHFQAVASTVGSPTLASSAPIGALLASLPEMSETLLLHDDWPQALPIFEREPPYGVPTPGWLHVTIVIDEETIAYDGLVRMLDQYGAIRGEIGLPEAVKALAAIPTYGTPEGAGVGVLL